MDYEDALAGEYIGAMLASVALWIVFVAAGLTVGGYMALHHL